MLPAWAQQLYTMTSGVQTRWTSPENPTGGKGAGAKENKGAKGHAFDRIPAHAHLDLLNVKGAGKITRIKLTVDDRSLERLRTLRIEMYWDGASTPAVSAPLGDFFGATFGKMKAFESAFFSDPEGRSFVCTIPMPYKKGVRIVVINDSGKDLFHIFYDVEFEKWDHAPENMLYFHAYWHQTTPIPGSDFKILPEITGMGKYLGAFIGVHADSIYNGLWWGEGEVKIYLDGDLKYPSLVGTGVEDYIGTAWGMGSFINRYEGCLIANKKNRYWTFYRFHVKDPVCFHQNIKVTIQQIGGGPLDEVRKAAKNGAPMIPISVDVPGHFYKLKEMKNAPWLMDKNFPDGWTNFYRKDQWTSTAYFYLNGPVDNLHTETGL